VAVDPRGGAFLIWTRFDGADWRIQVRHLSAGGGLGPVLTLSAAGGSARQPQLAVDSHGGAVFTWVRFRGGGDIRQRGDRVQARALSPAGVLSPVQRLAGTGQGQAWDPSQVAVDPAGDAVFAWNLGGLQARARSAGGALSPVQALPVAGDYGADPQVAIDHDGNAVLAWADFSHIAHSPSVVFAVRSADGVLGPDSDLAPGIDPQLAMDGRGSALFVWESQCPSVPGCIQVRTRSAAGSLEPIKTLSAGRTAQLPQVGVNAAGDAAVVWERSDGRKLRVQAAVRPG
jgi:hypothetical protein